MYIPFVNKLLKSFSMKIIVIAFAIMPFCIIRTSAQKINSTKVPVAVQNSFSNQFPKTKAGSWELEDKNYEVSFDAKGMDWSAVYAPDGTWMETEEEIHSADIPSAVRNAISGSFAGYKSDEIDKVTKKGGSVTFEVILQKEKDELEVVFDSSGNVLSKAPAKDEKD